MKRTVSLSIIFAGLFASMAHAQQFDSPVLVAVISCGTQSSRDKPNLLHRLLHRKQKAAPIPFVFHQSDYRALTPDTVTLWRLDEARRVGLHVPARLCAAAVASSAIPEHAAAARAANQKSTDSGR